MCCEAIESHLLLAVVQESCQHLIGLDYTPGAGPHKPAYATQLTLFWAGWD